MHFSARTTISITSINCSLRFFIDLVGERVEYQTKKKIVVLVYKWSKLRDVSNIKICNLLRSPGVRNQDSADLERASTR